MEKTLYNATACFQRQMSSEYKSYIGLFEGSFIYSIKLLLHYLKKKTKISIWIDLWFICHFNVIHAKAFINYCDNSISPYNLLYTAVLQKT